jgi:TIR domain
MILILAEEGTESIANSVAGSLEQEYPDASKPKVVVPGVVWDRHVEWDDLLLVVYKSHLLPSDASKYIKDYREAHDSGGAIIPIATNPEVRRPPDPISGIKAAIYDGTPAAMTQIVRAAGVFMGLAIRPSRQRIFVSYRATDGSALAKTIFERLQADGFLAWLDVAKENIAIGDDVQDEIRSNVNKAAMVLLIDTPDAPRSTYVSVEIDMANAQLVPVLPVVAGDEPFSRFIQLQGLRRQVLIGNDGLGVVSLRDESWAKIRREIEEVLISVYRRRLRILNRARGTFQIMGYQWQTLDDGLRMFRADKRNRAMPAVVVLSHCLVHDITYLPALQACWAYVKSYRDAAIVNQRLCIYDRERVLSEAEMETLLNTVPGMSMMLVHYNELELLVNSNFTTIRP